MSHTSLKQTWLLVKNRLLAQTGINVLRYEKNTKKKTGKLILEVTIGVLVLLVAFYLGGMAVGYGLLGLNDLTPSLAFIITSLITLFFTIFKANGELFAFKDYETLSSLPISARMIVNSRLLNMYLWNSLFSLVVMLPMGLVYAYFAKVSLVFYPLWLIGILLTSLVPTTIAAIIGAGITAIAQKFKYANAVATVLSFILIIGVLFLSMNFNPSNAIFAGYITESGQLNLDAIASLAPMLEEQIGRFYPLAPLFTAGIVKFKLGSFILFTLLSLSIYGVFVLILGRYYKKINTALTSHRSSSNYQLKSLQQTSGVMAIYRKTIMRILKSTSITTNVLVGCVMTLIAALSFLILGPEKLLSSLSAENMLPLVGAIAPFAIGGLVAMTNTACLTLALEGQSIWLIKSLPITPKELYTSYVLVNLTFTVPTVLVSSILVSVALHVTFLNLLIMLITPVILAVATAIFGIVVGNRLAYYDWESETHLVKQSMMSFIGMLGGTAVVAIIGAIVIIPAYPVSTSMATMIASLFVLIISWLFFQREGKRPIR